MRRNKKKRNDWMEWKRESKRDSNDFSNCRQRSLLITASDATMSRQFFLFLLFQVFIDNVLGRAPFVRDRPRGLGLLQLPTGMTDERSGPFFPGLYIAGDKAGQKPQTVPDVSLPGQTASFTGRYSYFCRRIIQFFDTTIENLDPLSTRSLTCFPQFTPKILSTPGVPDSLSMYVSVLFKSSLFLLLFTLNHVFVQGVNNHGLNVRKNFDAFADAPLSSSDGMYQPFLTAASVGAEYDASKIREVSGNFNLPIPGLNELFDFDGRFMVKGGGNGILNSAMEFPLTLTDPNERAPYTFKYLNFMADRHMHYGHVVPNVNLFVVGKDKIMDRLMQNRLNPTMIG
uniref:HEME_HALOPEROXIDASE domain-containing protein n=1 Tax=Caenorhabditis tropicalis TaxID=1561998 RepID=A0A1I7T7F9_9PELO